MTADTGNGAVAAGHAVTAGTAIDILKAGGNAFDAAVAAMAAACIAEPVLASPGGGGFMMALEAGVAEPVLIDFFGHTPAMAPDPGRTEFVSVFADFGPALQEFHIGHGASAVPGFLPGIAAIHERLCTMALADLLRPAIAAARDGIEVTPFQAHLCEVVRPILAYSDTVRAVFAPDGDLPAAGSRFANPGLADFLERFAAGGMGFWLTDGVAPILADQEAAGHLRRGDVDGYEVEARMPIVMPMGAATAFLNPPPSAGGSMVAAMVRILDREGLDTAGAMALADEAWLTHGGDPVRLLDALGIGWTRDRGDPPASPATRGTTHVSVIDGAGNAAAVTVTNGEGNGHMAGGFGFMPNNLLGEGDLMPRGFHRWAPDVRLASMMAPTVLRHDDGAVTVLGTGGSNRIRSAVFQTLVRLVFDDLDPEAAVAAPRMHVESGHLDFEDLFDAGDRARLTDAFADHLAWPDRSLFFGGVHVVRRAADGRLTGAGDPRRAGVFAQA